MKKVSFLSSIWTLTRPFILLCCGALIAALLTIATSCQTDPCKKQTCLNNGTCIDGTCYCAEGYEGEHCQTKKAACTTPPTCLNGGINNATCGCNCPDGFSGNLCEIDSRPACVKNHTGTLTIGNQYGHDLKVFIDGREIAIIHNGEHTSAQVVAAGSHAIQAQFRTGVFGVYVWNTLTTGNATVNVAECEDLYQQFQ